MRVFFALPLPDEARHELARLKVDLGGARWVPEAQLHVTVRFVGEIDEVAVARVIHEAEARRAEWPALHIAVRGLGMFGSARRPRVLWAALDPIEPIRRVAESLERAVRAAGLPAQERPFAAHVTLARFARPRSHREQGAKRREARDDRIAQLLQRHAAFATHPFDVPEVILYRSTLSNTGAVHTPLHRFALGIGASEADDP